MWEKISMFVIGRSNKPVTLRGLKALYVDAVRKKDSDGLRIICRMSQITGKKVCVRRSQGSIGY